MSTPSRIGREQALRLLRQEPLIDLMTKAHQARMERHPEGLVTFVIDTNPNYSNVCVTCCRFCAFYRPDGHEQAFTLSPQELADRVQQAVQLGATTVLLQGGHHPHLGLADWQAYISAIHACCPEVHIHPFSPAEIAFMAKREDQTPKQVLTVLWEQGIRTIPGGGAEILTEQVRQRISPEKCSAQQWLEVSEQAHQIGFRTTATMMYGHVETDEDIIDHLLALRQLQDRSHGFRSFIPWSFKPGNSPLSQEVTEVSHPGRYLRIIATARLVLDNVRHIQSSWFSENPQAGQLALVAGADDFGGLLLEENVLRETGFRPRSNLDHVLRLIRQAGFVPVQRNSDYELIQRFEEQFDE